MRIFMLTAIFAVFGCLTTFAQSDDEAGGYVKASVNDAKVKAAANYAVSVKAKERNEKLTLQAIKKAETQVVAGINYHLCMAISVPQNNGEILYIDAVIYQNLQGQYKLTSWEEDENNCGAE